MHMQSHDVCFTQTEIVSYFSEWCGTLATGLNYRHFFQHYVGLATPKAKQSRKNPFIVPFHYVFMLIKFPCVVRKVQTQVPFMMEELLAIGCFVWCSHQTFQQNQVRFKVVCTRATCEPVFNMNKIQYVRSFAVLQ